jgi:hypothetical protein
MPCYILTSGPEQNNTNTEWKLFIPTTNTPIHGLVNMNAEYSQKEGLFEFKTSMSREIILHVEDLDKFPYGIKSGQKMLIRGQTINRFAKVFEALGGYELIPTFDYNKDGLFSGFKLTWKYSAMREFQ